MALDLVQRGDAVPGADLAGVDRVVAEVLVGDGAVLEAEQPVAGHHLRVEVHLHLGVLGDGLQRAGQVVDEEAPRLVDGVHVGVDAVALVGQLLHQHVVVVAHAEADRGQIDAALGVLLDGAQDRLRAGLAHVGHAVRERG